MEMKEIFVETKKVISEYKAKVEVFDNQEDSLKAELVKLQEEMTANLLDQEGAGLSDRIYLKAQAKEINNKTDIINTMLEELEEARTALKLAYVRVYQDAMRQDGRVTGEYNATEIADKYRYLMLTEIAEIGKAMQSQYREVSWDIDEVLRDSAVLKEYPRLIETFDSERYRPSFGWMFKSVVSKDEVFSATRGMLPQGLKQPKGVK
ncbi:hypothetical protein P4597_19270 [Peribacillus simplex]|uniref:hypothetical protein n=1 Tax=Peribacillus simplex TaxID=1478 RepID=UPI002E2064F2|nr:hypothetical protein [Peribacillus simplex]